MYKSGVVSGRDNCAFTENEPCDVPLLEDVLDFDFHTFEQYCAFFVAQYRETDWTRANAALMLISRFLSEQSAKFSTQVREIGVFWNVFQTTELLDVLQSILRAGNELAPRVLELLSILSGLHCGFVMNIVEYFDFDLVVSMFAADSNAVRMYVNCLPILIPHRRSFVSDIDSLFKLSQNADNESLMMCAIEKIVACREVDAQSRAAVFELSLRHYTDATLNIWTRMLLLEPQYASGLVETGAFAYVLSQIGMMSDEERESLWRLLTCATAVVRSLVSHIAWHEVMKDLLQRTNTVLSSTAADLIIVATPDVIPQLGNIDRLISRLIRLIDITDYAVVPHVFRLLTHLCPHMRTLHPDLMTESFVNTLADLLDSDNESASLVTDFLQAIMHCAERQPGTYQEFFVLLRSQGVCDLLERTEGADQILHLVLTQA